MSIPISQFIPPPFHPLVSIHLFSMSVSLFLPCKWVHLYHFSRYVFLKGNWVCWVRWRWKWLWKVKGIRTKLKCIKIQNRRRESSQSKSESMRQEDNVWGRQMVERVEAEQCLGQSICKTQERKNIQIQKETNPELSAPLNPSSLRSTGSCWKFSDHIYLTSESRLVGVVLPALLPWNSVLVVCSTQLISSYLPRGCFSVSFPADFFISTTYD